MTLTAQQDAFGRALVDADAGGRTCEIVERDDGFIDVSDMSAAYLQQPHELDEGEATALSHARERVLDVGCGAGRHALALQARGHEVVGIDTSPGAVEVARRRGVTDARVMSITEASRRTLGRFDTFVMMGNNFGLMGSARRTAWLLRRFAAMGTDDARIIAQSLDVYRTKNPAHLNYHHLNRQRGRMPGQVRIRVRYLQYATPWFDYLMVSPAEMRELLEGTAWRLSAILHERGPVYTALIEKR